MGPNDTQETTPKPQSPPPYRQPARRMDPRLWALLPVLALLIVGAYFLGKYLNRPADTPPSLPPVVQAPPPGPQGKMRISEVPHALSVTPVTPTAPSAPPPQPHRNPAFQQEEPAVLLPTPAETPPAGEGSTDAAAPDPGGAPPSDDGARPAAEADRDPVKINDPAQEYPSSAFEEGVEGTSHVVYTVNAEGAVEDVSIAESSGDKRLDQAAVDYVKRLRYRPAIREGQPAAVRASRDVHFSLR